MNETQRALLSNISLLLIMGVLYEVLLVVVRANSRRFKAILGLGVGLIALVVMVAPFHFGHGIYIDTRSIILGLSGLFFGVAPTVIAGLIATVFRVIQGGSGMWVGIGWIFVPATIGLVWRTRVAKGKTTWDFGELYLFGLVINCAILVMVWLLPGEFRIDVLRTVALPILVVFPVVTVLMGKILDFQEQRLRSEQALRDSEEKFQAISDSALDAVIMIDEVGRIVYWNPASKAVFGYHKDEVMGKDAHSLIMPERYRQRYEKGFGQFSRTGHGDAIGTVMELMAKRKDGSEFPIEIALSAVTIGGKYWSSAVIRDTTKRKDDERKLLKYAMDLEHRRVELESLYEKLDEEMGKARAIHNRLLQRDFPEIDGLSFAALFKPAGSIGGDIYGVQHKGDKVIVYLSDVTGHSLDGAMLSAFVKDTIETYVEVSAHDRLTPDQILTYLATRMYAACYPDDYSIALFIGVLDVRSRKLEYTAAGFHTPPILIDSTGNVSELNNGGLPISCAVPLELLDATNSHVMLVAGSRILFSTDGLFEQEINGVGYDQRVRGLVAEYGFLPHEVFVDLINSDFQEFLECEDPTDDVTVLVMSVGAEIGETYSFPSTFDSLVSVQTTLANSLSDLPQKSVLLAIAHELAANAIEHGNLLEPNKTFAIKLRFYEDVGVLSVCDQGKGFPWWEPRPDVLSTEWENERGRGIALIRLQVARMVYNERGNRVSVLVRLDRS